MSIRAIPILARALTMAKSHTHPQTNSFDNNNTLLLDNKSKYLFFGSIASLIHTSPSR